MVLTIAARSTPYSGSAAAAGTTSAVRINMIAIAALMSRRSALKPPLAAASVDGAMRLGLPDGLWPARKLYHSSPDAWRHERRIAAAASKRFLFLLRYASDFDVPLIMCPLVRSTPIPSIL